MKALLKLQELDSQIEACLNRESEIPLQKKKFDTVRLRLKKELAEREQRSKDLVLEQRACEGDIEEKNELILKYEGQLSAIKKNEEYQALIHEIDAQKKQIGQHEERILVIMLDADDAKDRLTEDQKRISDEVKLIDGQCAEIDTELAEAISHRTGLEVQRTPIEADVEGALLTMYQRIKKSKSGGTALAPLSGEVCGGCYMTERAQVVNEVMGGKIHTCQHCGRLLYYPPLFEDGKIEA